MRLTGTEMAHLLRGGRTRALLALLALMLLASGLAGLADTARQDRESAAATARDRAHWLEQSPKNPHRAAHYGLWLFRPPAPLAGIDPGVEPFSGRMIRVEAHHPGAPLYQAATDAPPLSRAGAAGPADLLALVAPLVALLMGLGALAQDRETGRLRLAVGNGIPLGRLVAVRLLAALGLLAVAIAVPVLMVGVPRLTDAAQFGRLALLILAYIGYAALFLLLAGAAALAFRRSALALTAMLALWLGACVVAPRLAAAWVERTAPAPAPTAVLEAIDRQNADYNGRDAFEARKKALTARLARTGETGRINPMGALLYARDHHDYAVYDAAMGQFDRQVAARDHRLALAGLASPLVSLTFVGSALAGSDTAAQRAFVRAAEDYRRILSDRMNLALRAQPGPADNAMAVSAGADLWKRLPPFAPPQLSLAARGWSLGLPVLLLVGWLAGALALLALAVRRIQP